MTADISMIFSEKDFYKDTLDQTINDEYSANKLELIKYKINCTNKYSKFIQGAEVCRACLSENNDLEQLIEPEEDELNVKNNIHVMFVSCTSLELSWDDQYPKYICKNCIRELSKAYEFWKKCRQSIEKFNEQITFLNRDKNTDSTLNKSDSLYSEVDNNTIDIHIKNTDSKTSHKQKKFKSRTKKTEQNEEKKISESHNISTNTVDINVKNDEVDDRMKCENDGTIRHFNVKAGFRRCKKCMLVFPNKAEYAKHAKYHNKYLCPECGYFCGSIGGLHAHAASHSNIRPYQCNICSKQYKSQSSLKVHMRNHTGERRYTCDQCGVKFITWNSLNSHIKTHHSTARPYMCEICLKSFKQSSTLKIHKRQHTGEKPYPCSECNMAFKSSSDLKGHMVKHTGERNYPCSLCEKRFSKPYNLKQHMVTHTGERKHKCEICERAFTQAHVLRGHMKTHRAQEIELTNVF